MSPDLDNGIETPEDARALVPLLDVAFGFFVWAAHLLVIYISTAVSCQLGLATAGTGTRTMVVTALAFITVAAAAVVALHAVRRYRQQRDVAAHRFRMSVTIGCDAIAALAIAWQLFAITLVPICL